MQQLDAARVELELIRQTYVNGKIAGRKFHHLRWALVYLVVESACLILATLIVLVAS